MLSGAGLGLLESIPLPVTLELLVPLGQVPVEGACYRLRNELLVRILPTGNWRVEVPDQSTSHQSGAQLGLPDTPRRSQTTVDCASHDLADLSFREPKQLVCNVACTL